MKVRYKTVDGRYVEGYSDSFNTHGLGEIIVYFDDDSCDSMFIRGFEVQLPSGEWKNMNEAFRDRDIIPNNLNTSFGYPRSDEEKKQGFNW